VLNPARGLEPKGHLECKDCAHAVAVDGKPGRRRRFHPLGKSICGLGNRPEVTPAVTQLGDINPGEAPGGETRCCSAGVMQAEQVNAGGRDAS
jgi:hypothetical protein